MRLVVGGLIYISFIMMPVGHVGRLGERKVGDQVNLERAMGAHVRFGGHFVQVSFCV